VKEVKKTKVQTVEKIVDVPQVQTVERIVEVPQFVEVPQMVPEVQQLDSVAQAPVYGAPQPVMMSSQVMTAPPVYMTSPAQMTSSTMVQEQPVASMSMEQMPATTFTMMAPQMAMPTTTFTMPSVQYSSAPQTMVGTTMMAEPVVTRIEPSGMVMEQQAATYGAPSTTYIAGTQSGVMAGGTTVVSGTVQRQEGFLQHAMKTVSSALGLGGSQPTTTNVQGGGVTMASAPAGGVTSFGSAQAAAPVTYGAPGTVTTVSTGGYVVGGAGSASLFDQIDANKDGVISRAEFAQSVQQ